MNFNFNYVAGFLFSENFVWVTLIQKQRPGWQKDKLNAIGGKIEENETPNEAMQREFAKETGLLITDWNKFCILSGINNEGKSRRVHFFYAIGDVSKVKQTTDEKPVVVGSREVGSWIWGKQIPNLSWLVPMALNFAKNKESCQYFEVVEF